MLITARFQFDHMQQQAHMLVSKIKEQEVMIQNMQAGQYGAPQQTIQRGTDPSSCAQEPPMAGACDPSLVQEPTKAGSKGEKSK